MPSENKINGCVLIPTYNESKGIVDLITKMNRYALKIIVVDDGSSDGTADLARKAGAQVMVHPKNMGKGASLRTGFQEIIKSDVDFVVTMDGDGQHHPDEVEHFIREFNSVPCDVIVGNRMDDPKNMPYVRWMTNKIMSLIISSMCNNFIPDTQCGFRLIRTAVLREVILQSSNYEIETELLIQASKKGFRIVSVPISTIYEGQKSEIHPIVDTLRFFRFILRDRVHEFFMLVKTFFKRMQR